MSLRERVSGAWKALTEMPHGRSSSSAVSIYPSWAAWDSARLYGSSSKVDYAAEVGDLSASSLVMSAVRWLGNTLPEAPLQVKENKGGKGESVEIPDHPLLELFRRPNPYYSGSNLWKAFAFSWVIGGNAYFVKIWNKAATDVVQLWYEPHWSISPRWPADNQGRYIAGDETDEFIGYYELHRGTEKYRLEATDVIHFRDGIDPQNPRLGLSPMASILRELFTDNQAAHYSARIFKNMGIIPYVIAPKEGVQVSDDELKDVKASLIRQTSGDRVAEPIALAGAVELLKPPAFDPKQMEIKIARRLPEERFSAVTGIPAVVLGLGAGMDRSIYNNVKQADERAYEAYLIPLQRHIAEELNVQLLPDFENEQTIKNRYVRHDLSQVRALQEDEDNKSKRLVSELGGGMISLNQARSMRGLEPIESGDVFYIPRGVTVISESEIGVKPDEGEGAPPGLVKALKGMIKANGHEHEFKGAYCQVCQKSANEILEETKAENPVPPDEEIDATVEWFDETVPEAKGLLDAEVDNG